MFASVVETDRELLDILDSLVASRPARNEKYRLWLSGTTKLLNGLEISFAQVAVVDYKLGPMWDCLS